MNGIATSKGSVGSPSMTPQAEVIKGLNKQLRLLIKDLAKEDNFYKDHLDVSYVDFLKNKLLIVLIIRNGIPFSLFSLISDITPFSTLDWAQYLNISTKSLKRYESQSIVFKPIHTEKIIELAEVTELGREVFGSNEKFKLWLETPNFALGNLKPSDLLRDSYGKEMIIGELTRIEHGILG